MECFSDDPKEKEELVKTQNEIKGLQSLLNVKLDLNLDFNILRNIQDCLRLKSRALDFDFKKYLCGLINPAADQSLTYEDLWTSVKKSIGIDDPKNQAGDTAYV